jgi:hypothetical protein
MSQVFKVRMLDKRDDYQSVIKLISDIIVNEFKFKLEYDELDSDLLQIEKHYSKADGEASGLLNGILGTITTTVLLK